MWFRFLSMAMAMLGALELQAQARTTQEGGRLSIALTFDDLPVHSALPAGETRVAVVDAIIAALKDAHTPPVFGFVNAGFGMREPGSMTALEHWHAAGFPLGNHGWSHMSLNRNSADLFIDDVRRNEPALRAAMGGQDWHWLRYPYLAEGDTPQKRDAARAFLKQAGYRIAAVTMSFDDYIWNEPYARCLAERDVESIAMLEQSYLDAARAETARARAMAHMVAGRDIPYVLLMHAGAFDARMLPRLIAQYRAEGFDFVTLEQAQRDPFYRGAMDLTMPGPSPSLERAVKAAGLTAPVKRLPDFATLCK